MSVDELVLSDVINDFNDAIKGQSLPVVVNFSAIWCGPCRLMAPILKEISDENPKIDFFKLDIDLYPEVAREHNIMSIPTYIIFVDGVEVDRMIGASGKDDLSKRITSHV